MTDAWRSERRAAVLLSASALQALAHLDTADACRGVPKIMVPSGHQTWLENPRTEWMFLGKSLISLVRFPAMFDYQG